MMVLNKHTTGSPKPGGWVPRPMGDITNESPTGGWISLGEYGSTMFFHGTPLPYPDIDPEPAGWITPGPIGF